MNSAKVYFFIFIGNTSKLAAYYHTFNTVIWFNSAKVQPFSQITLSHFWTLTKIGCLLLEGAILRAICFVGIKKPFLILR